MPNNTIFSISLFNSLEDKQPKNSNSDYLVKLIDSPKIGNNKNANQCFAPTIFDGTRKKANATEATALVLDYDSKGDSKVDLDKTIALWASKGILAYVYTTFSHTNDNHCFRVVILLKEPIPKDKFPLLWNWALSQDPNIDESCKDISRMYFLPMHKKNAPYRKELIEGDLLDWKALDLNKYSKTKQTEAKEIKSDTNHTWTENNNHHYSFQPFFNDYLEIPNKIKNAIKNFIANNCDNSIEGHNGSQRLMDVSHLLVTKYCLSIQAAKPFLDEYNKRAIPPWQDSELYRALETASKNINPSDWRSLLKTLLVEKTRTNNNMKGNTQMRTNTENITQKPKQFSFTSLEDLLKKEIKPTPWLVEDLFTINSLNLLVGKPKTGKSMFALNLAIAVSYGNPFLGKSVVKANTLLLALEDGSNRLTKRLKEITHLTLDKQLTKFAVLMDIKGSDVFLAIKQFLDDVNATNNSVPSLVIVDTLAKVRSGLQQGQSLYDYDYQSLQCFRELIEKHPNTTILVTHHSRKTAGEDVLDDASGSTGLTGATDNNYIFRRARNSNKIDLHIVARDIEDNQFTLEFCYPHFFESNNINNSGLSSARQLILDVLKESENPLSATQIFELISPNNPDCSYESIRKNLSKMKSDGHIKHLSQYKTYCLPNKDSNNPERTSSFFHNSIDIKNNNIGNSGNKVTAVTAVTAVTNSSSGLLDCSVTNNDQDGNKAVTSLSIENKEVKAPVTVVTVVTANDQKTCSNKIIQKNSKLNESSTKLLNFEDFFNDELVN